MMSFRTARSLAMAFVLAATCAAALAAAQEQRYRGGVDLVSLNVTVMEGTALRQRPDESDFEVYEDGAKQTITFFSRVQQPIALAILLDTSASMNELLSTAQEAAIGFAKRLRKEDAIEVIDFDSQVRILQTFTNDVAALERAIRGTDVNGSTSLYNAIYISLKELKKAKAASADEIRRQAIVVLSDGDDTSSLRALRRGARPGEAVGDGDLRDRPAAGRRDRTEFKEAEFVLKQLAQETGGRAYFVHERRRAAEDLRADLRGAGQPVQHRLLVEEPDAQRRLAADRRPRRQAGLTARTRQGYYGPDGPRAGWMTCTSFPSFSTPRRPPPT